MRSFGILSLAASAAFSLLAAAAPLGVLDDVVVAKHDLPSSSDVSNALHDALNSETTKLHEARFAADFDDIVKNVTGTDLFPSKRDQLSVPQILAKLDDTLKPVIVEINYLTSGNATAPTVQALLQKIVDAVNDAVNDVTKLVGAPVNAILASVDGTVKLTVDQVAPLVANVLELVICALAGLLKLINGDLSIVGDLLNAVCKVLFDLLSVLLKVVDGLLDKLLPLVNPLLGDILALGFQTLAGILGLI